ncbi:MAG: DUF4321 domain-containing protein [Methylocystaceae bacterium]
MNSRYNWASLLMLMLLGAIIFAYLGELLIVYIPLLNRWGAGAMIGIPAVSINLAVVKLSFAFQFKLNLFTVLGLLAGLLFYRRL